MSKLSKTDYAKKVKEYFGYYPEHSHLFFSEDGNCFLNENACKNHAATEGIKWEKVLNPEIEKANKLALAKQEAKDELAVLEVADAGVADLRRIGKLLDVTVEKDEKSEWIVALTAKKAELFNDSE